MDSSLRPELDARLEQLEQRILQIETWMRAQQVVGPAAPGQVPAIAAPEVSPSTPPSLPPTLLPQQAIAPATPEPPSQTIPPPSLPPAVPVRPRKQWSLNDLERLLSGRGLAWIGGLAILIGIAYFLSIAFTRGWIGPGMRVAIGLVAGGIFTAGGAWFFERREKIFGHVLVAVGLGAVGVSLIAATRLYALIPVSVGLALSLMVAVLAATIAIRANSQIVAAYGLLSALLAPPILGAAPNLATMTFLATALVGTTAISLYRAWSWLPIGAFLLTAPQLLFWVDEGALLSWGLVAIAGFALLNGIAAAGEELRRPRNRLRPSSASLLVMSAAFTLLAGYVLLDAYEVEGAHGLLILAIAVAHGALAGLFLLRLGPNHPFGLLVAGTAVAAFTLAVAVQLGGPIVPMAWAAEAVAFAWVYGRARHRWSGGVALILATLAIGHLILVEYGVDTWEWPLPTRWPFVNERGGTLLYLLLALAAAGYFLRASPRARTALAITGLLLMAYALPAETALGAAVAGWAVIAVVLWVLGRRDATLGVVFFAAAGVLVAIGLRQTVSEIASPDRLFAGSSPQRHPFFWSEATLALGALAIAGGLIARLQRGRREAGWIGAGAGAILVYMLSVGLVDEFSRQITLGGASETLGRQAQVSLSILWAALGGFAFVVGVVRWQSALRGFGLALLAVATAKVFLYDLASLDATYKVASFIALGLLLLVSSYAYQRRKPDRPAPAVDAGDAAATGVPEAGKETSGIAS